ncbi:hypothetical protein OG417_25300 [Actinoallomurus sp. NBC_01490]|uniref:hypothetical protein n=1 Tax=Actinoallomurus sp. NBC_01490 TaxID=2903557 RepID=UPI002E33A65E|nr:hypothetical protein [Actinoallomurus sp. NBC_01490]
MTAMAPTPYRVMSRRVETHDVATLTLEPCGAAIAPVRPGQFTMLYAFGVGEAPISVSRAGSLLEQTIRDVGAVSHALHEAGPGQMYALEHRDSYGDITRRPCTPASPEAGVT